MGRPRDLDARDRILQATFDLVTTPGADASINAIVARAGVGKATVYRWWGSRTAVVLDALEVYSGRTADAEEPAVAAPADWTGVRARLVELVELFKPPHGALVRDLLVAMLRGGSEAEEIRSALVQPHRDGLEEVLRQGQAAGTVRDDVDVSTVADALIGPLWLSLLTSDPGRDQATQEIDPLVEVVREGAGVPA